MKKRIIALILVVVMSVLALASCGFNLAEDDLSAYTEGDFDVKAFLDALQKIEIKDGEYTTDEATNKIFIESDIYEVISSSVLTALGKAGEYEENVDGKYNDGTIGAKDVVYYCYYISYEETDKDGNKTGVIHEYKRSEMNLATIKATATAESHTISLGKYNEDDAFTKALAEALKNTTLNAYSMSTEKNDVKATDTISISYTVKVPDGNGGEITKKAVNQFLDLNGDDALATALKGYIGAAGTTFKVGSKISVAKDENYETNKTTETTIKVGEDTYTDITVDYVVESMGSEITFEVELEKSLGKLEYNELHNSKAETVSTTLDKGKTVKYHIFPVYRVAIPENTAEAVIEYVYGSKLSSYLEKAASGFGFGTAANTVLNSVLNDKDYKVGDKTSEDMIKGIVNLWKKDYSAEEFKSLKELSDALSKLDEEYTKAIADEKTAKTAYDKAAADEKAAKEALDKASEADKAEKQTAYDKAKAEAETKKKAYEDAQAATDAAEEKVDDKSEELEAARKAKIKAEIATLVTAKNGEKVLGTELMALLEDKIHRDRKAEYDSEIMEAVETEVYKLIDKMVTVKSYPEELVEDFRDRIYNELEYKFYTGTYSSSESNYAHYNGNIDEYIAAQLKTDGFIKDGGDIDEGITKKAEHYIEPLIKMYTVARAFDAYKFEDNKSADEVLSGFVQKDIEAKLPTYFAYYFYNDDMPADENENFKVKLEENAASIREDALESAKYFLIDDEAFDAYKDRIGNKTYREREETYGELNIRANLQISNLFDLIFYTNNKVLYKNDVEKSAKEDIEYVTGDDGAKYIEYAFIKYTIKAESDSDTDTDDTNK